MRLRTAAVAALIALVCLHSAAAQDQDGKAPDPRLAKAFDSLGVKYDINSSGNYVVSYQMDKNQDRSHYVYVISRTETYESVEIREMWGIGAVFEGDIDPDILYSILQQNSGIKIGAWGIEYGDGEVYVLYMIKIPVNIEPRQLADLIYFVAEVCDEFEEEYVGDDIY